MAKQQKDKGVTKDRLVGMKIIDSNGNFAGTVKDIGFTIGKVGISLSTEDKEGEAKEIAWDEVQAAGDFVLLKPPAELASPQIAVQETTTHICPICKGPLTFVKQYQRWYCYKCQKYV